MFREAGESWPVIIPNQELSQTAPPTKSCQICGKNGHIALDCWNRYNQEYQTQPQAHASQMYHHNNASGDATMLATPSIVVDPLWYPDSGASHHITHDDSTLSTKNTYTGSDKVNIGNGTGLNIHHVGHSYLHCPKFSKTVILNNLLHVPSITKKLLSVSQFARDNHVFFEFYPNFCTVKTQGTRETVLQGQLRGGLYVFPPMHKVQPALAFSAEKSSSHPRFTLWHPRLGHPSPRILKVALRNSHIPCNNFPDSVLSDSYCMGKAHELPFINSNSEYHTPLQLVFSDVTAQFSMGLGPNSLPGTGRFKSETGCSGIKNLPKKRS
uniref:Retrovirus-related Pol polyprotein from transposon TNT 1-94 n=1 Tax=Cajanus cajan TaxID=3821 RepID=A0A151T1G8_CAJCA|nr:Retrovirus-related Pol polyprotein from transposon TNT 1-94 [Cajanus cajan]